MTQLFSLAVKGLNENRAKRFISSLKAMLKKKPLVENQSINQRMPHLAMMLNLTLGFLILVDSEGKRKMGGYNRPITTH